MQAKDIIGLKGSDVRTIARDATLNQAISDLAEHKIGALLVVDASAKPCGIISERDIVRVLAGAPTGFRDHKVEEAMTAELITCAPSDSVDTLMDRMTDRRIRHLPVMEKGELKGLLSIGDVVKHRMREVREEADALKSYISHG
ncbi:CBS domain-containing protein [Parvularcula maris]|uniref:CBS domain-containing protein n=1 Tax=Parvularcula maris TaxID=2965077 RepID=A0A9X2LAL7_9PROT|nr:CBS domain-containing protein [Parvularcula maris]MCQ8186124.1 CBS domain-containing protein [Parvularcula maris]